MENKNKKRKRKKKRTLFRLSHRTQALLAPSHLLILSECGILPSVDSPRLLDFQPRERLETPVYSVGLSTAPDGFECELPEGPSRGQFGP